ncbi:MAG TPA: MerR family transcriptional regulator [Polyangiaceae bacterium]|jgi:DNA-binding transcriptional MerR regulator
MVDGFTTEVTAKLSGVSTAVLENWLRARFLAPSVPAPRRGVSAKYSFRDLVAIRVVCELRDAGISLQALTRVVKYLRARKGLSATDALASTTLVTDGHDVFEVEGAMTISALRRPGQRVLFVVPLDELVNELQIKARALRAA